MKANSYIQTIEFKINGIPCLIGVTDIDYQKPDYNSWDSDIDYYGYFDVCYDILDRKGYKAAWLERKLTSKIEDDITQAIETFFYGDER